MDVFFAGLACCAAAFALGYLQRLRALLRETRATLAQAMVALEEAAEVTDDLATSLSEWRECCRRLLCIVAPQEAEVLGREIAELETRTVLARGSLIGRVKR